jgi:hypothetical protein
MTSEAAVAHFSVWYVAQPTASQISAQLDWILGFQIHRALHRPLLETPSRVSEIAKLHEIDMPKPMAAGVGEAPIIVSVSRRLPVQLLVVVPWTGALKKWAAQIVQISNDLKLSPSLIHLPDEMLGVATSQLEPLQTEILKLGLGSDRFQIKGEKWI